MKQLLLLVIYIHQHGISFFLKSVLGVSKFCRFSPSCSEYAKRMILQKGAIKGSWFALVRLASCQPFFNNAV